MGGNFSNGTFGRPLRGPAGRPIEVFVDEPQDVRQYADKATAGKTRVPNMVTRIMLGCEHGDGMFQPNRKRVYIMQTANILYFILYIVIYYIR